MPTKLLSLFLNFASGLRFKSLFIITAGLFFINLITPDPIPLIDELLLGLGTLLLSSLKKTAPDTKEKNNNKHSKEPGITIEGEYEKKN